jgi:L,D-peptidoglycan transpeptidase YkuD (ErfK/YbiS/YcfS/YnhG family)
MRSKPLVVMAALTATLMTGTLLGAVSGAAPASAAGSVASRLRTLPAGTRQVLIVHGTGYHTTSARLEAYTKVGRSWRRVIGPVTARIGSAGFTDTKVEGDRATPTGVYAIGPTMYGTTANPGVRYQYHRLVPGDWWNENPDSPAYNGFTTGTNPGGASEPLWRITPQYSSFAVIDVNTPAVPGRGSGIFLHQSSGHATLGCVSLPRATLVRVLRWLNPAAAPRVVLAPDQVLGRC